MTAPAAPTSMGCAVTPTDPQSSRDSAAGAGWTACAGPGPWKADVPVARRRDSWIRPRTLWNARNDTLCKVLYDPVDRARQSWVGLAAERGADPDFIFRRGAPETTSFLLLGDPGEGDNSQYAVVPPLLSQAGGVDFAVIASDVTYPAGEMGGYDTKFFRPYRDLDCPIYAIPGNHDWYDGLHGFMSHICGIDAPEAPLEVGPGMRGKVARALWRRTMRPEDQQLAKMRGDRGRPTQASAPPQPGPYWAMDAGPVRIVGIDTGVIGTIDAAQADWLRRVSYDADRRPKILVTGKPLIVNGKRLDPKLGKVVDDIVRDPGANYVMAIGGDTHNYQRYPVTLGDGRTIQYVVSGGGGAYTHATHQIPRVDVEGVQEDDFRCYPLRSDSLARFSQLYDARLGGGRGRLVLSPAEAATHLSRILRMDPTRDEQVKLSRRARIAARLVQPAPGKRGFHRFASEFFDWEDPPFFKQFLRIDVDEREARVRCYGVTGCVDAGDSPPVEDEFTVPL